jgi:hypothetical protein
MDETDRSRLLPDQNSTTTVHPRGKYGMETPRCPLSFAPLPVISHAQNRQEFELQYPPAPWVLCCEGFAIRSLEDLVTFR